MSIFGSGNGATAPGEKPVASSTSCAFATRAAARIDGARDLRGIATSIAGHEREDWAFVADEHERLHDLPELATDGVGGVLRGRCAVWKLVDPRFDPRFAEEGGHPLDRLWPGPDHPPSLALAQ